MRNSPIRDDIHILNIDLAVRARTGAVADCGNPQHATNIDFTDF